MSQKDFDAGATGANPHYTMDLHDFRRGQESARLQAESSARAQQQLNESLEGIWRNYDSGGSRAERHSSSPSTYPAWVQTASKACGAVVAVLAGIAAYQTTTIQPIMVAVIAAGLAGLVTVFAVRLLYQLAVVSVWLAKALAILIAVLFALQLFTGVQWGSDALSLLGEIFRSIFR